MDVFRSQIIFGSNRQSSLTKPTAHLIDNIFHPSRGLVSESISQSATSRDCKRDDDYDDEYGPCLSASACT